MAMHYNPDTRCFEGERLAVPELVFAQRLQRLIAAGGAPGNVWFGLLDEDSWNMNEDDVVPLPSCLHCFQRLDHRQPFCSVVCEASFYAATFL